MDWEHLKVSFLLLETYIITGGSIFLRDHAAVVGEMFIKTVGNVKAKATTYVMLALDAMMRKFPKEGARMLAEGGVLRKMAECCRNTIEDRNERVSGE